MYKLLQVNYLVKILEQIYLERVFHLKDIQIINVRLSSILYPDQQHHVLLFIAIETKQSFLDHSLFGQTIENSSNMDIGAVFIMIQLDYPLRRNIIQKMIKG